MNTTLIQAIMAQNVNIYWMKWDAKTFDNLPNLKTNIPKDIKMSLLYIAGYVPEQIDIYQTLPNYAHVYRVKLDSVNGGFIFVRWNKKEQRHVVANKMIDPGLYYNLNAAQEILRMQTDKATFSTEDISLQASDQFKLSGQDINGLRKAYEEKLEAQKKVQANMHQEQLNRAQRKVERKKSKSKNLL